MNDRGFDVWNVNAFDISFELPVSNVKASVNYFTIRLLCAQNRIGTESIPLHGVCMDKNRNKNLESGWICFFLCIRMQTSTFHNAATMMQWFSNERFEVQLLESMCFFGQEIFYVTASGSSIVKTIYCIALTMVAIFFIWWKNRPAFLSYLWSAGKMRIS